MPGISLAVAATRQSAAFYTMKAQMAALYRDAATGWWAAAEREAWLDAVTNDPLLPGRILPSDYLGPPALVLAGARRSRRFNARWQVDVGLNPLKCGR